MRVGLLVGWTTAVAAALDPRPRQRPVGTCWIAVSLAVGLLGLLLRGVEGLLVGTVIGASVFFVMIMVLGFTIESALFWRADRVWLLTSPAGRACAKVTVTDRGAWNLTSVAAWPFNRQLGTHLVGEICRDADTEGCEIVLEAQNPRVAALYNKHHFVDDPGRDRLAMKRLPTSVRRRGLAASS